MTKKKEKKQKNKKIKGPNYKKLFSLYKTFGHYYKRQRGPLIIAFFCILGSILGSLLNPWPLKLILDNIILGEPFAEEVSFITNIFGNDTLTLLLVLAVSVPVLTFLNGTIAYWHAYYMAVASHKMTTDIREHIFGHIQKLSLLFHKESEAGDMVYRFTSDIKDTRVLLVDIPRDMIKHVLSIGSIIAVMLALEWRLALVAASVIPIIFIYALRFGKGVGKATKKKKKKEGKVASIVSENIASMALVQAYGQEASEKDRFDSENQASADASVDALRLSKIFKRVTDIIVILGTVGVVYFGAQAVLADNILPGTLVLFVSYLKKLYSPIDKMAGNFIQMSTSQVAANRLLELVQNEQVVEDKPNAIDLPDNVRGRIELDNVSFAYKEGSDVIKNLNLVVPPGQQIALVGHSGAGKSTLVGLLLRFYEPRTGAIYIDDININNIKLNALRNHITILFQDAILLRKSVRDNLLIGKPDATDEEVVEAAKKAQAHEFIMGLPDGYDTLIEEGGENFSGGQQQRLSIARAILRNSPILILDEPATGLDARSEAAVQAALAELMRGKTTFVIAHRFQTIRNADKILVLEQGEIAQMGNHQELMRTSTRYRDLYEIQFGAQDIEDDMSITDTKNKNAEDIFAEPFTAAASMELHGVHLDIRSNNPKLIDYLQEHAQSLVTMAPDAHDIHVRVLWVEKADFDAKRHTFGNLDQMNRIGRRVLSNENELVWLDTLLVPGLQLRFRLEENKLAMDAIYRFNPSRKPKETWDAYRIKKYFSLAKYFIYFPVAWYLEYFHNLYLLHASAVKMNGKAVVIAGVGGVGKTTTCMALMKQDGAKLISENLIFYDDERVYSCYEPLRADDGSVEMLGFTNGRFRPGQILPRVKDKNVYHIRRTQTSDSAQASAIFIPKFGKETALTPLNPDLVVEQLLAINTQTREINAYYQFAATLGLMWPKGDRAELRILELADLLNKANIYELSIDPSKGVEPVVRLIQEKLNQE